ncbi:hypothetical protein [Alloscardovia macacae]|uniref:Immunity protein 35 domain-containing protein n=1 Tax=Alloscardovia macacae TaxID=1160091 RepID=A0A261F4W7_9BIFI|nr:hypothetical protein [Alloscardovia macacae]OZG54138.1 hypothetical protein ALMA_0599 [Alloscardovia macacae]
MDYSTARAIVEQHHPGMVVAGLSQSVLCWAFILINEGEEYHDDVPGAALSVAVDRGTGEFFYLVPGTDAFWKYMPDLEEAPIPKE